MAEEDDFFKGRSLARAKASRLGSSTERRIPLPEDAAAEGKPATVAVSSASAGSLPAAMPSSSPSSSGGMVDVGGKPIVRREATAEGFLRLLPGTLDALRLGTAPKGDPFPVARVAGVLAAKNTPQIIPFCHPLALTGVDVDLMREAGGVRCRVTVRSDGKTGVEMEALAAVTAALLTVWDMTKMLEKDERGQYPGTTIEGVRVLNKVKG